MSVGDGLGAFPARLLTCRRLAGLSQEELADLSGLSVRTISNLERGRTRKPYLNTRQRLADALELKGQARNEFLAARRPRDPAMIAADPDHDGDGPRQIARASMPPRHLPAPVPAFVGQA